MASGVVRARRLIHTFQSAGLLFSVEMHYRGSLRLLRRRATLAAYALESLPQVGGVTGHVAKGAVENAFHGRSVGGPAVHAITSRQGLVLTVTPSPHSE